MGPKTAAGVEVFVLLEFQIIKVNYSTAHVTVAVLIVSFNIISCSECSGYFANVFESFHERLVALGNEHVVLILHCK